MYGWKVIHIEQVMDVNDNVLCLGNRLEVAKLLRIIALALSHLGYMGNFQLTSNLKLIT
jgi:hypothetical protein